MVKLQDSLRLSWKMKDEWIIDGFFDVIVEGRHRLGKSSYCCQAKAKARSEWSYLKVEGVQVATCVKPDHDKIKKWIVFPHEFLERFSG